MIVSSNLLTGCVWTCIHQCVSKEVVPMWTLILMLAASPGGAPAIAPVQGLASVEDCIRMGSSWAKTDPSRNYSCLAESLPKS
jgi:hypothetical protein